MNTTNNVKLDIRADVQQPHNETEGQRKYLERRLTEISYHLKNGLRKQFHIDDDEAPKSPKEMRERIEKGMFVIPHENEEKVPEYWYDEIKWRDPKKPADRKGYTNAKEALAAAELKVKDIIKIRPVTDGLDALDTFGKWKH